MLFADSDGGFWGAMAVLASMGVYALRTWLRERAQDRQAQRDREDRLAADSLKLAKTDRIAESLAVNTELTAAASHKVDSAVAETKRVVEETKEVVVKTHEAINGNGLCKELAAIRDAQVEHQTKDDAALEETRNSIRSEERRVGKECTSWCRSRWSPYH